MAETIRLSTLRGPLLCIGCRKNIGEPHIQYRFVGCAVAPKELLPDDDDPDWEISDVRKGYDVPAHNIEIRVTEVADHDQATKVRLTRNSISCCPLP